MSKIINLSDCPEFRARLIEAQLEKDQENVTPPEEWEVDDDVIVLSQDDMSELVDAYKMIQDGLDKIKEITKLDYEKGAFG